MSLSACLVCVYINLTKTNKKKYDSMFIVLYKYFLCVWWIKRFFSVRKLLNVLNDSGSKNEIDKEYSIITVKATHHQSPAGGALRDFNPKADDHSKLLWFFIFSCILIYYIQRQDPVIISSRPRHTVHGSLWLNYSQKTREYLYLYIQEGPRATTKTIRTRWAQREEGRGRSHQVVRIFMSSETCS